MSPDQTGVAPHGRKSCNPKFAWNTDVTVPWWETPCWNYCSQNSKGHWISSRDFCTHARKSDTFPKCLPARFIRWGRWPGRWMVCWKPEMLPVPARPGLHFDGFCIALLSC